MGLCLLLVLAPLTASAQTNAEVNAGIQFNFSVPGARSLGLGGAFIALADDATAAYANPAGLTILSRPEVSVEGRAWRFENVFTDRGRLEGFPSGNGIDTIRGLQTGTSDKHTSGMSFLSLVYPDPRQHWAVALYRHELAHFAAGFETYGAIISTNPLPQGLQPTIQFNEVLRLRPARHSLSLEVVNYGLSAAYRFSDSLSLGAGLSYYDFSLHSLTTRYGLRGFTNSDEQGSPLGAPLYTHENISDFQTQDGKDRKMAMNLGFAWKSERRWYFGAVYRQGPRFNFVTTYETNPQVPNSAELHANAQFNIPDVLGLGVAYQPTELTTISLDYVHIRYSELTRQLTDIFQSGSSDLSGLQVDDGNEIHLGIEQNFNVSDTNLAVRAGAWRDPDHQMRYEGSDLPLRALFPPGHDEIHYSAGLGFIRPTFTINLAFDLADRLSVSSLSTVVFF